MEKLIKKNFNTILYFIGSSLYSIITILISMFLTYYYPQDISLAGKFTFAFYISSVFATIGNYGGRIMQISDYDNDFSSSEYIRIKYYSSTIMMIIALVFFFISNYSIEKICLLLVFMIYRFVENIIDSYYGICQKNSHLNNVGISIILKTVLSFAGFLVLFINTKNMSLSSIVFIIISLLIFFLYDTKKVKPFYKKEPIRKEMILLILKKNFSVFLSTFITLGFMNVTRYFVDIRFSEETLSIFSLLILPASLIILFSQIIIQSYITKLSTMLHNNGKKAFYKQIFTIIIYLLFIGAIFCILTYFFGTYLMNLLFNYDFSRYSTFLVLSILSGVCSGLVTFISTAFIILRKLKTQLFCYLFSLFIYIIISYLITTGTLANCMYSYFLGYLIQLIIMLSVFFLNKKQDLT